MRIAIDIKSALKEKTGKGVYAYNMALELISSAPRTRFTLYVDTKNDPVIKEFSAHKNVEIICFEAPSLIWQMKVYSDVMKRFQRDSSLTYFAPCSFIVTYLLSLTKKLSFGLKKIPRYIITVHDLVAFKYGDTHNKKAVMIEKCTLKPSIKDASIVCCVSKATESDLLKMFPNSRGKTLITHNGLSGIFKTKSDVKKEALFKQYNLKNPYILSLGTLIPRKNLKLTLRAFDLVTQKADFKHDLVIVGGSGWGNTSEEVIESARKNPRIHALGYVPLNDLPALYEHADVFVYPSLYEGFGIPVLEAMSQGTPVIISDIPSLNEVAGDSAFKVDPGNPDGLTKAIKHLIDDQHLRHELSQKGYKRCSEFSFEKSAKALIDKIKDELIG